MKKLNITKEQFNRSNYFQKKYGKLEYVSESGKLFKTNKGIVLEFTDGYEGRYSSGLRASGGRQDDPLYGTQGYCGHEPDVDWEADREDYEKSQIEGGVILRRTNKVYDLWRIETVDAGMRLEENIHGFKKAEKLAKKNGWKIVKTIPTNASESSKKFNESVDIEDEVWEKWERMSDEITSALNLEQVAKSVAKKYFPRRANEIANWINENIELICTNGYAEDWTDLNSCLWEFTEDNDISISDLA